MRSVTMLFVMVVVDIFFCLFITFFVWLGLCDSILKFLFLVLGLLISWRQDAGVFLPLLDMLSSQVKKRPGQHSLGSIVYVFISEPVLQEQIFLWNHFCPPPLVLVVKGSTKEVFFVNFLKYLGSIGYHC